MVYTSSFTGTQIDTAVGNVIGLSDPAAITGNIVKLGINGSLLDSGITIEAVSRIKTVEDFGAVGDGVTDDTIALQSAFNTNSVVFLTGGKTYCATNLTIPNVQNWTLFTNGATIKRIVGGDTRYLIASYKYVNNISEAQDPIFIWGDGCFDGNSICDYPFISQSWNSEVHIEATGGVKSGILLTAETYDGTVFSTSSLVNTRWKVRAHHNGGCGLFVQDSAKNKATDGYILPGSYFYVNQDHGVFIEAGPGWDIQCNTYGNVVGGIGFYNAGPGTRIHDSYIDDGDYSTVTAGVETILTQSMAVYVNTHISTGLLPIENCFISGPVTSKGGGTAAPYGILSKGNQYYQDAGSLYHQYFGPTRFLYSVNDTFQTDNPFRFHNGSSTGRYVVKNAVLLSKGYEISGSFNALTDELTTFITNIPSAEMTTPISVVAGQVNAGAAFSFTIPIPHTQSHYSRYALVTLTARANHDGILRIKYTSLLAINTKLNSASNAWTVTETALLNTPEEWTTQIAYTAGGTITDNTGTLTIAGNPAQDDCYGFLKILWL